MKKFISGILALIIGLSLTFTVSAEITVPDEVRKMSGEEGYKKGYEDALKASVIPVKTEYQIDEYVPFQEFEVKITGAERITSSKSKTPAVKIYYSFKNLKDEETSPLNSPGFTVYQNLIEMDRLLESGKEGNFMFKV